MTPRIDPTKVGKYAVHTYRNTEFLPWWGMLNGVLERRSMFQSEYGEARDYYKMGFDPEGAAQELYVIRGGDNDDQYLLNTVG